MNTYFHNFFIALNDDSEKALSELAKLINSYGMKLDAISNYAEGSSEESIIQVTVFRYAYRKGMNSLSMEIEVRPDSVSGYAELVYHSDFIKDEFPWSQFPQVTCIEEDVPF